MKGQQIRMMNQSFTVRHQVIMIYHIYFSGKGKGFNLNRDVFDMRVKSEER